MLLKFIFTLTAILILCSLDTVLTKAINTTEDSDDYSSEEYPYHYTAVYIPSFNLSSIVKPSSLDKLRSFVIEELELLAPQIDENGSLYFRFERDFYNDEDVEDVGEEEYEENEEEEEEREEPSNTTETETTTQTEVEPDNESQTPTPLDPELEADIQKFFSKFIMNAENNWNLLSEVEKAENEHFSKWLKRFKDSNDTLQRMDLLNTFFRITYNEEGDVYRHLKRIIYY